MTKTNDKIDYGKSCEKLKKALLQSVKTANSNIPGKSSYAFGLLESAVKIHLGECTDQSFGDIQKEVDELLTPANDIPASHHSKPGLINE